MVTTTEKYVELRRQRLEENKKRMEQLNLHKLSQSLNKTLSPKPSPMKGVSKPRSIRTELVPVRRSSRLTDKPTPMYKEVVVNERVYLPRRIGYSKRDLSNRVYASDEGRAKATLKAEELEESLGPEFPTFVKPMLQSHVTGGFWLGLPSHFCKRILPKRDDTITLIDESGEEWPTVFLSVKAGLSGGWRKFAIDHDLVDGDALVFQLIRATVFKVFIIRVNNFEDSNSLSL
ncbi:hypothetical protein Leryth_014538 [Lithospermum erythrorhizon]|uniref:TF-B3 domain-containing protein n=1 Tax=Lithospermum erythrorhizon TaxID=34254 RepID=A0AAV3PUJ7_LITER|nr:hypothetical protein Leryth_014538 [Lithospermum erythrorhizon]